MDLFQSFFEDKIGNHVTWSLWSHWYSDLTRFHVSLHSERDNGKIKWQNSRNREAYSPWAAVIYAHYSNLIYHLPWAHACSIPSQELSLWSTNSQWHVMFGFKKNITMSPQLWVDYLFFGRSIDIAKLSKPHVNLSQIVTVYYIQNQTTLDMT